MVVCEEFPPISSFSNPDLVVDILNLEQGEIGGDMGGDEMADHCIHPTLSTTNSISNLFPHIIT